MIKENAIFAKFLYINFNYNKAVSDCEFPTSFKNANVLPIYKKDSRLDSKFEEKIYRLINIFPNRKYTKE